MDIEKLQLLSKILCAIPHDYGENLVSFSYVSMGFDCFTISCWFNWKCDRRVYETCSIDEAIDAAYEIHERILGYPYDETQKTS